MKGVINAYKKLGHAGEAHAAGFSAAESVLLAAAFAILSNLCQSSSVSCVSFYSGSYCTSQCTLADTVACIYMLGLK